jgi:hypothetical protein
MVSRSIVSSYVLWSVSCWLAVVGLCQFQLQPGIPLRCRGTLFPRLWCQSTITLAAFDRTRVTLTNGGLSSSFFCGDQRALSFGRNRKVEFTSGLTAWQSDVVMLKDHSMM